MRIVNEDTFRGDWVTEFILRPYTIIENFLSYFCDYANKAAQTNVYSYKDKEMIDHTLGSNNFEEGVVLDALEAED